MWPHDAAQDVPQESPVAASAQAAPGPAPVPVPADLAAVLERLRAAVRCGTEVLQMAWSIIGLEARKAAAAELRELKIIASAADKDYSGTPEGQSSSDKNGSARGARDSGKKKRPRVVPENTRGPPSERSSPYPTSLCRQKAGVNPTPRYFLLMRLVWCSRWRNAIFSQDFPEQSQYFSVLPRGLVDPLDFFAEVAYHCVHSRNGLGAQLTH